MTLTFQSIILVFTVLYLFASMSQKRPEKQRFFLIAAVVLATLEGVAIAVL